MNSSNTKANQPILLIKYGGNAMVNEKLSREIVRNIGQLKAEGYQVVLVHGGGPFIQEVLDKAGVSSEFAGGHRVTSEEALPYIEMALKGQVNGKLVQLFNQAGHKAVGISGKDGGMVQAVKRLHEEKTENGTQSIDLGQVGDVAGIDTTLIKLLLAADYIPVVACLGSDAAGKDYNINADMFAGHLAGALKAQQFLVLTDVDGLLEDVKNPDSLIRSTNVAAIAELIDKGIIAGGMIPKMESCQIALEKGAAKTRIINGTKPEQLLSAVGDTATGTIITKA